MKREDWKLQQRPLVGTELSHAPIDTPATVRVLSLQAVLCWQCCDTLGTRAGDLNCGLGLWPT